MKDLSPVKAIRAYCIECSGNSCKEVRECIIKNCPLYPFRLGKNPNRKGIGYHQFTKIINSNVQNKLNNLEP